MRNGSVSKVAYFLNVALLGVSSLVLIPALVSTSSAVEWAQIAVGQAIGGFCGVVVGLGWGITGPASVANENANEAAREYRVSLRTRSMVLLVFIPALVLVTGFVAPDAWFESAVAAIGTAAVGVGPGWYFIGRGRARDWLMYDTLPRAIFNFVAVGVMLTLGSAAIGLLISTLGVFAGLIWSSKVVRRDEDHSTRLALGLKAFLARLRGQRASLAASILGAFYGSAPLVLVSLLAPGVSPLFALLDKLHKQVTSASSPFVQIAQRQVAFGASSSWAHRARKATVAILAVALAIGLIYGLLLPFVADTLTIGAIHVNVATAALSASLLTLIFLEQYLSKAILPSLGGVRALVPAGLMSTVIGVGGLAIVTPMWGANGALGALLVGISCSICYEGLAVLRLVRSRPAISASPL